MKKRLENMVAIVTGGASGIGASTARKFVEHGALVVIADVQVDPAQRLASELGGMAEFVYADVTSEADVATAVDKTVNTYGRLDCMINNAGIVGALGSIAEISAEAWDRTISVLLTGTFYGVKHAARVMIPKRSGCIISVSSTAGIVGGLGPHAYTAAKHAIVGLTKSAASELAQYGIRVNCLAPGNTVTPMTAKVIAGSGAGTDRAEEAIAATSRLGIAGQPQDQANALLYLASDEARYMTGHTLVVDAGQTIFGAQTRINEGRGEFIGIP